MDNENVLKCHLMSDKATLPTRGSVDSAGLDIYSSREIQIEPGQRVLVSTDLIICVPKGCYGRVAPRSGLAVKHGIDVGAGVVDSDYRGEVKVLLFNFGEKVFKICTGDRIAQLIIEKIQTPNPVAVSEVDVTVRGGGGFGSTGI